MTDYPPTEYGDWQRARGHMTGEIPLRSLEQARAEALADWHLAMTERQRMMKDRAERWRKLGIAIRYQA